MVLTQNSSAKMTAWLGTWHHVQGSWHDWWLTSEHSGSSRAHHSGWVYHHGSHLCLPGTEIMAKSGTKASQGKEACPILLTVRGHREDLTTRFTLVKQEGPSTRRAGHWPWGFQVCFRKVKAGKSTENCWVALNTAFARAMCLFFLAYVSLLVVLQR